MAMLGEAVARNGQDLRLDRAGGKSDLSAAQPRVVSRMARRFEPNHSHFVLVESNEWGGEIGKMLNHAFIQCANVAILVNGGAIAADETCKACAMDGHSSYWGSGRFAGIELRAMVSQRNPRR